MSSSGRGENCAGLDNLNTHTPAALYEVFPPAEARRLMEKLELHFTPKHGSWLIMAEIELSVLSQHPFKPAHRGSSRTPTAGRNLATATQSDGGHGRLAFYDGGCAHCCLSKYFSPFGQ